MIFLFRGIIKCNRSFVRVQLFSQKGCIQNQYSPHYKNYISIIRTRILCCVYFNFVFLLRILSGFIYITGILLFLLYVCLCAWAQLYYLCHCCFFQRFGTDYFYLYAGGYLGNPHSLEYQNDTAAISFYL